MRTVILTVLSAIVLAILGAVAFVYSGIFNVAADEPHSALVLSVLETARVRSIQAHAAGIVPPSGYDTEPNVVAAAGHFAEHCVICHGAPGVKQSDLAKGMYPRPPDLTQVSDRYTPGQIFWIVKHGIKMTAMPTMADDGDPMLWATVAFLQRLPRMSEDDYNELWMKAQAEAGQGHGGMGEMKMGGSGGTDTRGTSGTDAGKQDKH